MPETIANRRQRVWSTLASARAAGWVHAGTLALGAVVLLIVGRGQWFYFDEWDFMWQPEALRRLVEGHNGHWSLVPIGIWLTLQNVIGLGSYLPYLAFAIVAHLVLAHLVWRLLLRVNCLPWLATILAAAFVFFGTATENLMWAFQMGYMGAIAFAVGALLLVSRPRMSTVSTIAAALLLAAGAATAGTALPFFASVALVALFLHGWRRALLVVVPPSLVYLFWYVVLAGENPTAIYRASGFGESLRGIPEFMARMFVDGLTTVTPVPGFGVVLVAVLVAWAVIRIGRRSPDLSSLVAMAMLAAGVIFAGLTAYSRLGLGPGGGTAPRYAYLIVVTVLPAIAVILSRVIAHSARRMAAVAALVGFVAAFNFGALLVTAASDAERERATHALISAASDLAADYPADVDADARPDPVLVPRTLSQLQSLEEEFGLDRVPYTPAEALTALVNVGVRLEPAGRAPNDCSAPLQPGDAFTATPEGVVLSAGADTHLVAAAVEGAAASADGTFALPSGATRMKTPYEVQFKVRSADAPVTVCASGVER